MKAQILFITPEGNHRIDKYPDKDTALLSAKSRINAGEKILHVLDEYGIVAVAFDAEGAELTDEALAAYADDLRNGS